MAGRDGRTPAPVQATALFAPRGRFGLLYWYAMYPAHLSIFGDMVKAVAQLARTEPVVSPPMRARVSHEPLI